jgi:four helix bundle protein
MDIKSFEDLEVWKKAKDLVLKTYKVTEDFPKDEIFGVTSQIKRAALSVPANIAEGFGRYHYLDKAKFYLNARGSLFELKSHMLITADLGFLDGILAAQLIENIDQLGIKLNNLVTATRKRASEKQSQ